MGRGGVKEGEEEGEKREIMMHLCGAHTMIMGRRERRGDEIGGEER